MPGPTELKNRVAVKQYVSAFEFISQCLRRTHNILKCPINQALLKGRMSIIESFMGEFADAFKMKLSLNSHFDFKVFTQQMCVHSDIKVKVCLLGANNLPSNSPSFRFHQDLCLLISLPFYQIASKQSSRSFAGENTIMS